MLKDGEELVLLLGTEHLDAGFAEVGDTLEDGRGGEVSAGMQDAAELGRLFAVAHLLGVATLDIDAQLLLQHVNLLV